MVTMGGPNEKRFHEYGAVFRLYAKEQFLHYVSRHIDSCAN